MASQINNGTQQAGQNVSTGILQLCFAMLFIPILDVFAKLLGQNLNPVEVTMMRFLMQIVLMAPFVIWSRLWRVPKGTLWLQLIRGVLLAIATACFFAALQHLPMAEAISIYFAQPLILTGISALLLGETIRQRRIIAIVIGLVGVLVILQPSVALFGWPAFLPLATALSMAGYVAITRQLAGVVHPYQMQFVVGLTAAFVLGLTLVVGIFLEIDSLELIMPNATELQWVVYMGLVATVGHIFIVWATANAPASVLAPFQYLEIVSAIILGYAVFGDVPGPNTVIGVLIIIASGIYLFHRERIASRETHYCAP
jgi:S-adenosylmethionine uptake transporter